MARQTIDPVRHHVLVVRRLNGNRDAGHATDLRRPNAGAVDQGLTVQKTLVGPDSFCGAPFDYDIRHFGAFEDRNAQLPRPLGKGLGNVRGVGDTVAGQECGTVQIVDPHLGQQVLGFLWRNDVKLDAEGAGDGRRDLILRPAVLGTGEP